MADEIKDGAALEKEFVSSSESLKEDPIKTALDEMDDPDAGKTDEERKELVCH